MAHLPLITQLTAQRNKCPLEQLRGLFPLNGSLQYILFFPLEWSELDLLVRSGWREKFEILIQFEESFVEKDVFSLVNRKMNSELRKYSYNKYRI